MKRLFLVCTCVMAWLVFPTVAAIAQDSGPILTFKAPAAFWAGNAKMPAGSYRVTQGAAGQNGVLILQNAAGTHEAFVDVTPVSSPGSHKPGEVVFDKVGSMDFLSALYAPGSNASPAGYQVIESSQEKYAEKSASKTQHSIQGTKPK